MRSLSLRRGHGQRLHGGEGLIRTETELASLRRGRGHAHGSELGWGHLGYSRDSNEARVTTSECAQVAKIKM